MTAGFYAKGGALSSRRPEREAGTGDTDESELDRAADVSVLGSLLVGSMDAPILPAFSANVGA
jgi:hypothetical protein